MTMLAAIQMTVQLLKLRIGIFIAASALAGMAVTAGPAQSPLQAAALAIAVLGASGAAGAFNHYYDRDIDSLMQRTNARPFASGAFRPSAWWPVGFAVLLSASLALAAAAGGSMAALFVFLGAFTYGVVYTVWLKRRSAWNIVIGGLAGSFAVLAGAAAVDPAPQVVPMVLAVVLFLWTPPHFWSLAIANRADYAQAGVPMLPVVVGPKRAARTVLLCTTLLFIASLTPLAYGAGPVYGLGALAGGVHFVYKSWQLARRPEDRAAAMGSFFASLVQLSVLLVAACLDAALR